MDSKRVQCNCRNQWGKMDVHKQKQTSFIQGLIHSFQQKWKSKLVNAADNKWTVASYYILYCSGVQIPPFWGNLYSPFLWWKRKLCKKECKWNKRIQTARHPRQSSTGQRACCSPCVLCGLAFYLKMEAAGSL